MKAQEMRAMTSERPSAPSAAAGTTHGEAIAPPARSRKRRRDARPLMAMPSRKKRMTRF